MTGFTGFTGFFTAGCADGCKVGEANTDPVDPVNPVKKSSCQKSSCRQKQQRRATPVRMNTDENNRPLRARAALAGGGQKFISKNRVWTNGGIQSFLSIEPAAPAARFEGLGAFVIFAFFI